MASTADLRAMNAQLVDRVLADPPAPIPDDGYGLRVLDVPGRRSGRSRRTPVGLLRLAGSPYLVSPDGQRDWPENVRAAGRCWLAAGDQRTQYLATELTDRHAAEIVSAYLRVVTVPWARAAFGVDPDASVEQIADHVHRMAVFSLADVVD